MDLRGDRATNALYLEQLIRFEDMQISGIARSILLAAYPCSQEQQPNYRLSGRAGDDLATCP
jgi:hypothetical protein